MTPQHIIDAIRVTAKEYEGNLAATAFVQALRGIVARAERYEAQAPKATFTPAPSADALDLVSELRAILAKPEGGIEAAQRIEQYVHEVLISHTEGKNPTLAFVNR